MFCIDYIGLVLILSRIFRGINNIVNYKINLLRFNNPQFIVFICLIELNNTYTHTHTHIYGYIYHQICIHHPKYTFMDTKRSSLRGHNPISITALRKLQQCWPNLLWMSLHIILLGDILRWYDEWISTRNSTVCWSLPLHLPVICELKL